MNGNSHIVACKYIPKMEYIDREMAERLLATNYELNRKINPSHLKKITNDMMKGIWKDSPEPIIVSDTGKLLDGQHRLNGLLRSGIAGITVLVVYNTPEDIFECLNTGKKRDNSDLLGIGKKESQIASAIGRLLISVGRSSCPTPVCKFIHNYFNYEIITIREASKNTVKCFSSAPFTASAVVSLRLYPEYSNYIIDLYKRLNTQNPAYGELPNIGKALFDQNKNGTITAANYKECFSKGLLAFNYRNKDAKRFGPTKLSITFAKFIEDFSPIINTIVY